MRAKRSLTCLLIFFSLSCWASAVRAQDKAAAKDVQEWKRYNLRNGLLSVLLPSAPRESIDEQTPKSGSNYKSYIYVAEVKQGSFTIGITVLSDDTENWSEGAIESFYNGVWYGISKTIDTEFEKSGIPWRTSLIEKRKVKFSGYDGREFSFSLGILKGRLMITLIGHHAISGMALGTEGMSTDDREQFFNSITISIPPIKQ
jgi:hypothetical protein